MDSSIPEDQQLPDTKRDLNRTIETVNLAEDLDEELLTQIGAEVHFGYQQDLHSKSAWDRQVDDWVKLAAQVCEQKTYPWPQASNIKYPLLATASLQFAARAYPSLIPADGKVVQFKVVGADQQGMKAAKADKLAKHMNWQLTVDMVDWEEEMDRLLIQMPTVGCLFKKTYFDPVLHRNVSRLVGPKDLVVNYWATSLEEAHRKTEILQMNKNQLREYINAGVYMDVDLPDPKNKPEVPQKTDSHGNMPPPTVDTTTPYVILEQHTYWDLDDDGYQEPYIITIEESSKKVLRIVARFDSDGIKTDAEGKLVKLVPVEYYTKYGFIPNPDGGFYDIGFGHLLGSLNESANTLVNLLVDAGHISNLQAGFIGKGLRMKMGEARFRPGEWKAVNTTGDDIKKQIFPLPTREPSEVLFKLLGMIVESGDKLASVAEIFTGKLPGQNTPATTTQASIEQGMKVFTAIYKRTYRAMTKEFKKLFRLNSIYTDNFEQAQIVLDEPISPEDYDIKSYDVCPTADPTAVSTTQKALKAQALLEILPLGTLNPMEVTRRVLEAQEQPNLEALMLPQQMQKPDPKIQVAEMKMKESAQKMQNEKEMHQLEMQRKEMEAMLDMKMKIFEQQMDQRDRAMEAQFKRLEAALEQSRAVQEHKQSMAMSGEAHRTKLQQMKEVSNERNKQRAMARVERPSGNGGSKSSNKGKN